MPNIKSAKKRVRISSVKQLQNKMANSAMKTYMKKVETAVAENNREVAMQHFPLAVKAVEKAVSRNIIHRNNGSRKISKMQRHINAIA